jgi:beta-galactosidase
MFHSTLLPVGGTGTRGWRRTVELGRDLARLAEVAGSRVEAETALILDWEAWWALEQGGHPTSGLRYRDEAIGWYGPLHRAGVAVDVRGPDEPLDRYRLVVAPNLFMLDPAAADALARYVEAGGILLLGTASGLVDRAYHVPGGHHPALLRELAGIRWEETWPILGPGPIDGPGGASLAFDAAAVPGAGPVAATIQREALELAGATAVARHVGGELDGWPAVTRRAVGAGEVWYVGTAPDPAGRERLIAALGARAGVAPVAPVPPGVRVARRVGEDASFLVYVNHAPDRRVVVAPGAGLDLLTGRPIAADEALSLEPLDAVVLRLARG